MADLLQPPFEWRSASTLASESVGFVWEDSSQRETDEPTMAHELCGKRSWQRDDGESIDVFKRRVEAEIHRTGGTVRARAGEVVLRLCYWALPTIRSVPLSKPS